MHEIERLFVRHDKIAVPSFDDVRLCTFCSCDLSVAIHGVNPSTVTPPGSADLPVAIHGVNPSTVTPPGSAVSGSGQEAGEGFPYWHAAWTRLHSHSPRVQTGGIPSWDVWEWPGSGGGTSVLVGLLACLGRMDSPP